jgi:predicted nuclease of restriction endonuclease-like (RecB) superfamily
LQGWGAKAVEKLAHDLRIAFPEAKGCSLRNLKYMRVFAGAWQEGAIVQQAVGQLPWVHNIVLLTKLKDRALRLAYAEAAIEFGSSCRCTACLMAPFGLGDDPELGPV